VNNFSTREDRLLCSNAAIATVVINGGWYRAIKCCQPSTGMIVTVIHRASLHDVSSMDERHEAG
jgi:hypothetical protein